MEQCLKEARHAAVFRSRYDDEFRYGYAEAMDQALDMVRDLLDEYHRPRGGAR